MAKCGDFGGTRAGGEEPCGRPAGWGTDEETGRCRDHPLGEGLFGHIRHPKKRRYLQALSRTGNKSQACRMAEIDRSTPYTDQWRDDEELQESEQVAIEIAADLLEEEARRRAVEGVEKPVGWYRGEAGGHIREYSDTLLIVLLKATRPQRFAERVESRFPDGPPTSVSIYLPENRRGELPEAVKARIAGNGARGNGGQ